MTVRHSVGIVACVLALAATPAGAQSLALDDLKSIDHGVVTGEYGCAGTKAPANDVRIVYTLAPRGERRSRVTALTVRGDDADAKTLAHVDAAIGSRSIEGVSVDCSSKEVRLVLVVYGDDSPELERVVLHKRKDAPLVIAE